LRKNMKNFLVFSVLTVAMTLWSLAIVEGSPLKPLNWSIDHGMVQNGKGVCYVLASNFIVAEVGNKSEHGVSLKSGTVSALQQAAKRLEATASAMLEKAAQIEKYGLDNLE
jgi:hypothetical protein